MHIQNPLFAPTQSENIGCRAPHRKPISTLKVRTWHLPCCVAWLFLLQLEAQDSSTRINRSALPEPGYYLTGTIDISEANGGAESDLLSGGNNDPGTLKFAATVNTREQASALWTVELGSKIWYLLELSRETRQIDGLAGLIPLTPTVAHLSGDPNEVKAIVSGWWNDQPLVVGTGVSSNPRFVLNLTESNPGLPVRADWKLIVEDDEETEFEKWSRIHFGNPNAVPTFDSDGDGVTNWDEFLAGTNPRDSQDYLKIESVRLDEQGRFEFRWRSSPNREYTIWKRLGIDKAPEQIPLPDIKEVENGLMQFTEFDTNKAEPVFYRIEVVHPFAGEGGQESKP